MKQNLKHTLEIVDYTYDGLGIGKVEGFPIFVSNAGVGDIVKVEITKHKKNLAFAKVVEFIEKKSIKPVCKHFYECGGCHIMHLPYQEQLRFKTNHVANTIKRIGKVDTVIKDTIGMDNPYHYRNKLIIPFEGELAGLYRKGTHDIVDVQYCHILNEQAFKITQFLRGKVDIRNVLIRSAYSNESIMVVLISRKPVQKMIVEKLIDEFPNIVSIINNLNNQNTNVILGKNSTILFGKDEYEDELLGNVYRVNHRSFYQINIPQTEVLYAEAIQAVDLKDKVVLDAYCGIGTIGLSFAKDAKHVYGIEINPDSIVAANENAKLNGIDNVTFIEGKSEEKIQSIIEGVDVVITDPPRKGCGEPFLQSIIDNEIKEVVYVSCNVSTLARDIEYLNEYYNVEYVQPVDMFPHTYHVECVAKLSRR